MSEFDYDKLREEGRVRARSTAVWDASCCSKELWEYQMAIIPHDAIGADLTKHAPHNSNFPKFWYRDESFHCKDCGKLEVWAAEQQKWWFEVAKGQINSRAIRCRACRQAYRKKSGKVSHAERMAPKQE